MSRARGKPTPEKHHIKLHVIPEPAEGTRTVLVYAGEGTVMIRSEAAPNVLMNCGSCGVRLVQGVVVSQLSGIVLKCNGCGAYNETIEG
jgi:hypothetical protein